MSEEVGRGRGGKGSQTDREVGVSKATPFISVTPCRVANLLLDWQPGRVWELLPGFVCSATTVKVSLCVCVLHFYGMWEMAQKVWHKIVDKLLEMISFLLFMMPTLELLFGLPMGCIKATKLLPFQAIQLNDWLENKYIDRMP